MKKWEQSNLLKYHNSRIKNAKSTFSSTLRSSQGHRSNSNSSKGKQKPISVSSFSLYSCPLYSILQAFSLEEYSDSLIDLDYGYDFNKFKQLKGQTKQKLLDKIGVKSGDRYKMSTLFDYLANMVTKMNEISPKKHIKPKSPYIPPFSKRSNHSSNIVKSSQYTPATSSFKPTLPLKTPKKPVSKQTTKHNKSKSKAVDDSVIIHKTFKGKIQPSYTSKFLIERLTRKQLTQNIALNDIDLDINRIKNMYLSFDSGKLTSNIVNIDIEELTNCLALQFYSYIKYQQIEHNQELKQSSTLEQSTNIILQEIEEHPIEPPVVEQKLVFPSLPQLPRVLEIVDQGNQSIFQSIIETKKQFIESIMKQSMLKMTDIKSKSPSFIEYDLENSNIAKFNESLNDSRGVSHVHFEDNFPDKNHLKSFQNRKLDEILKQLPSLHVVEDFIKNLLISLKMQKQAPIFTFVYFKRLLEKCNTKELNQLSWRNVVLVCLLLGSKVWDDCSLQNDTISRLLPLYPVLELNRLEKIFVKIVDYKLTITPQEYTEGYFQLRKHCKEVKHSKGLKQLTLEEIKGFQKMSSKLEITIRHKYKESLNKSF